MEKVRIIAEAGVNHNGDIRLARKLIDVAKAAGADFIKFQTFKAKNIASINAAKADYQKKTTSKAESQLEMLERLELAEDDHKALMAYCRAKSITFLSTPFDLDSINLLKKLGLKLGKIPSGEITNLPYLEKMAKTFDELILSTGMADLREIQTALDILVGAGAKKENITVLHCNTEYPTPMKDVNLRAMQTMQKKCKVKIGYSDHTMGIEVPIAAVALGATVIEKHITLDRGMEGPDHKASLEPGELSAMVAAIRNIEMAMGDGVKKPSLSEQKNIAIARKSIVAAREMPAGHVLHKKDLLIKRPGNGISPLLIDNIIGRKLLKPVMPDELLTYKHFAK